MSRKSTIFFSFLLALSAVTFLCSCSQPQATTEAPGLNEIKAGDKFLIILPEDHRKGETWQLTQDYDRAVIQQLNEVWHGNEKGLYFNLQALAAGQTTLSFVKRKYTDTLDFKQFIIKTGP